MEQTDSLAHIQTILEYWTLVEFFSPYLLENVLDNKQSYQKIYANEPSLPFLPWVNAEILSENDPMTHFAKDYHPLFGTF